MKNTINQKAAGIKLLSGGEGLRVAVLCLGVWLHAASSMLAATTLPSAVREFGGGYLIGWAFTLYLLGSILAGAGTGIIARRYSLKSGLIGAAILYLAGCVVCALAPDMISVLIGRLLQGTGGGFMVALTYVSINQWYSAKQLPRLFAIISALWSVSAFCGPLVGGTFSTFGNWRMAFWAFVLQAILFVIACIFLMPSQKPEGIQGKLKIPFTRLAVLCLAILSVAIAGTITDIIISPLLCVLAVFLLGLVFKLDASRRNGAMFPSKPISPTSPSGAGLLFVLTASIATMSFLVYGPILLETLHGVTPLVAGYIVAFESIAWGIAALAVSNCKERHEVKFIRLGAVLISAGILGFALMMSEGPMWGLLLCAAFQGAGFGVSWAFVVKRITANTEANEKEAASAAIPTMQQIGFAFGATIVGLVANAVGFGGDVSITTAKLAAPWIFVAFLPLSFISIFAAWRMTSQHNRQLRKCET